MAQIDFGPYEPDIASVGTKVTNYVLNVLPRKDGYGPIRAATYFSDAMSGLVKTIYGAILLDSSSTVFGGNATKLYKLNGVTNAWDDVTRTSGGDYSLLDNELWDFAQFGNYLIAVADNNAPQVFTLGTSSNFSALGGSPPQARRVGVVGDFLVLAGLTVNPNRVQWSAINDTTGWTAGTNQSDYQDFPDGGTVQGFSGGEFGLIFQDRAIRRMIYTGPPTIFQFQKISEDRGVLMRYSICKASNWTFFLANDGFYKIDSNGVMTPIGKDRVDNTVLADFDPTQQHHMIGRADPVSKRIFWFYKSLDNENPWFDKVLIYDWVLDRWSFAEFNVRAAASVIPLSATLEGLDAIGDLDSLPLSLDTYTATYSAALAVVGSTSKIGFLDGSFLEATIDTPEGAVGNGERMMVTGLAPVGDASTAYVSVIGRDRLIDATAQTTEATIGVRGYASLRSNNRFSKARVRVPAAATWTYLRGVDVEARKAGRR